jgi:molybdopterin converting factor small subunit
MTARLRLPRLLSETVAVAPEHQVEGTNVSEVLDDLFSSAPGLRNHIVDETGRIRPHVSVFVDGVQAGLDTEVGDGSELRVLNAVSGG